MFALTPYDLLVVGTIPHAVALSETIDLTDTGFIKWDSGDRRHRMRLVVYQRSRKNDRDKMKHNPNFMDPINRDLKARKVASKLLDVAEDASEEELKRAYRRAAVTCHPDHVGNTEDANKRFALTKCAYELLANDKPCEELLEEIASWTDAPGDDRYRLDNPWGHFLWWRDKFLEPPSRRKPRRRDSCI